MREREREREREAETQAEGEAGSMQGARRGTRSWVLRIRPWAEGGAKLLSPPGCPTYPKDCFHLLLQIQLSALVGTTFIYHVQEPTAFSTFRMEQGST